MNLILNGRPCHVPVATLAELLEQFLADRPDLTGRVRHMIGTAHNGMFVPRERRDHCQLTPGDRIEILLPGKGG